MTHREERTKRIQDHLDAIRQLQGEEIADVAGDEPQAVTWPPQGYYWLFHVLIGMMLDARRWRPSPP